MEKTILHKVETKKRLLYFTVQQPFFSLFFTFCRSPAPPFPAIPVHGAAL